MVDYTAIEYERAALVVIDMQDDFVSGVAAVEGTSDIVDRVAGLVEAFRAAGRPVFHLIRYYRPGGSDVDPVRRAAVEQGARIAAPDSPGADIPAVITGKPVVLDAATLQAGGAQQIGPEEFVLYKPRWSAFHRTSLQERLEQRGVTSVVVAGCNLPNCPRATLFDATERDLRAALAADAVSQVTPERLRDLELIGVHLLAVDEIRAALGGGAVPAA